MSIEYIDYGTEEDHDPSCLRRSPIDNPLNSLPPQAIKCQLEQHVIHVHVSCTVSLIHFIV